MEETYTKKQCAEKSGLTLRQVQFFTESGLIETEATKGGTGNFRRYPPRGLMQSCIIKELTHYGMTMQTIKRILGTFNAITLQDIEDAGKRGSGVYLVMSKKKQGEWEPAFAVGKTFLDGLILQYQDNCTSYMVVNLHALF
jgi:DNA-binding transcriptional MerR regulator